MDTDEVVAIVNCQSKSKYPVYSPTTFLRASTVMSKSPSAQSSQTLSTGNTKVWPCLVIVTDWEQTALGDGSWLAILAETPTDTVEARPTVLQ